MACPADQRVTHLSNCLGILMFTDDVTGVRVNAPLMQTPRCATVGCSKSLQDLPAGLPADRSSRAHLGRVRGRNRQVGAVTYLWGGLNTA